MNRRTFLAGTATTGLAGVAGCLDVLGESHGATEDVVLDPPDRYEDLRASRDNGYLPYPIHGDELPEVSVPDVTADGPVSTRQFVGDRHVLLTFVFTRCNTVCPTLTSSFAQVQHDARENGYAEDIALLPTTFDPAYDTPERLVTFAEDVGADPSAANWRILRPESPERAEAVVEGEFGVIFSRVPEEKREMENMVWNHRSSRILANKDGYVERNYRSSLNAAGLLDEVATLRERW